MLALLLTLCTVFSGQTKGLGLIPMPNSVRENVGKFNVGKEVSLCISSEVTDFNAQLLDSIFREGLGANVNRVALCDDADFHVILKPSLQREEYNLLVTPHGIRLEGGSNAGVYYGLMTFGQIVASESGSGKIACVEILDSPRYAYRALMIDPARQFLPIEEVMHFVDLMSRFKYNVLQLHLTDDQGWRIEIKSHPELTQSGAYYTQDELKTLVAYAAERNVEIVPEIDIPGHTAAFLYAHPELMCEHNDSLQIELGKTVNLMLCASKSKVYEIYDDIIGEIASVFPSELIHLGGDESAISANWEMCTADSILVENLGFDSSTELMAYFFNKIFGSVRKNGKRPMMWCELDNIYMPATKYFFEYPQDVTLVTWRNGLTPKCIELTERSGNRLIMSPGEYTYLDYPQYKNDFPEFNNWGMPITTLEQVYSFDPSYGEEHPMIYGVMGTLWAEAIPDINRLTYMAYPRALALAEAGWSQSQCKDWISFKERLVPVLSALMQDGISFRVPFEIYGQKHVDRK